MSRRQFIPVFVITIAGALILAGCGSAPTLHSTMEAGDEAEAIKLIRQGADIDKRNYIGNTPLHEASIEGSMNMARALVNGGANLNARNFDGRTPLMLALVNGYTKTNALLDAVASGNTDMVAYFLNQGFDINTVDRSKTTGLHIAAKRGNSEMVTFLVKQGAALDIQTDAGWTAMHFAAQEQHPDLIGLLLSSGAKPVDVDNNGAGAAATARIYEELAAKNIARRDQTGVKAAYEQAAGFYLKAAEHYRQYAGEVSEKISNTQLLNILALVAGATAASIAPGSTLPNASGGTTTLYAPVVVPQRATGSLEDLRSFFEEQEQQSLAGYQRCLDLAAKM